MILYEDEKVLAAWASRCSGPGYQTRTLTVLVEGPDGLRLDSIPAENHTDRMHILFDAAAVISEQLRKEVDTRAKRRRRDPGK